MQRALMSYDDWIEEQARQAAKWADEQEDCGPDPDRERDSATPGGEE